MKNIFTLCALVVSVSAFAQQQKGDLSIQFSGNYYQQRVVLDNKNYRFGLGNIYLKVGKYFTDNVELGLKPNAAFSLATEVETSKSGEVTKTKSKLTTNLGFGIYGTYSFLTANGKFLPYAGAELAYAPIEDEQAINLGPYAGVKYFVTERINVDANLSWLMNLGSTYEEPRDEYLVKPMWNFNIGIGVLIGKLND
jgi:outer membrane protein W